MNVLIVDDEPDIRTMVSMFLNHEGMNVDTADLVDTAKSEVNNKPYAAALLDLNLPDGTGFDLIPDLLDKNQDCKIIIISAYDNYEDLEPPGGAHVDLFMKKPFSKKQLIEAVKS